MPKQPKTYRYAKVASEAPSCPSCGLAFKDVKLTKCLRCQFDLASTDLVFPYEPPAMEPIMDHLNTFSTEQIKGISAEFAKLTKKYPQVSLALCNLNLISSTDPRVFGFWMLNRCPLSQGESSDQRKFTLLLVIDQENQRLSASCGLALEPYLPTSGLSRALDHSYRNWLHEDPVEGATIFAEELQDVFKKSLAFLKRH